MRRGIVIGMVAALMALSAADAQAVSVATVDMKRVMAESSAARSAKDQLKEKQQEFQSEVAETETSLQQRDQELAKQRNLLSNEAFKEKLSSFREEAASAQKDVQRKRLQLRRAFEMSIVTIQKRVRAIVADIASSKGYDLVLPKAKTLYYADSLDITDTVLGQLNEELPKLKVEFEEAAE